MNDKNEATKTRSAAEGSIEPEGSDEGPQVTVRTSAFVDDYGAMYYQVYRERIDFFFGKSEDNFHVGFTDRALMNLVRLATQALYATLRARGILPRIDSTKDLSELFDES